MPLSVAIVVGAIAVLPWTADALTWIALILVPIGCALALGWAMRGAHAWLAVLASRCSRRVGVSRQRERSALRDRPDHRLGGHARPPARRRGPAQLLKLAVIAMAVVDAILVFSNNLQPSNAVLVAAVPAPGLPQLQSAEFLGAGLGYGDFFAAAVVGGILPPNGGRS